MASHAIRAAVRVINCANVCLAFGLVLGLASHNIPSRSEGPTQALHVTWDAQAKKYANAPVAPRKIVSGKDIIRKWEGLELKAYRCKAGVLTIGYGSTKGVKPGMKITKAEAERLLDAEYRQVKADVIALVRADIDAQQLEVLTAFAHNVGITKFRKSTLRKLVNAGDTQGAVAELMKWVHVRNKVVDGLMNRRMDEASLFVS